MAGARCLDELGEQLGEVVSSLPERGNLDRDDVEPEQEIFAKVPLGDPPPEIRKIAVPGSPSTDPPRK